MISQKTKGITIFHYHLLPGGVTDVIILSTRVILTKMPHIEQVTIVSGRMENNDKVERRIKKGLSEEQQEKITMVYFPLINYSEMVEEPLISESLAKTLINRFGRDDTLWMIHNYHLGKNPNFTQALLLVAEKGTQPLFFQIHDFPECSRYVNLTALKETIKGQIYPQLKNVAYGVINARDVKYLTESGIERNNIFLLNNPVPLGEIKRIDGAVIKETLYEKYSKDFPALKKGGKLLFYPVRTIRRKNILEAALLIKMIDEDVNLLVTLPGESASEKPYSEAVERAYREGLIPGAWGIGGDHEDETLNYQNFWAASDLIISSSIQEGFGYLYLNALHWEKPLFTRHLDIMDGFISLFRKESSHFYKRIPVPLTKAEISRLRALYKGKRESLKEYMPPGIEDPMALFEKTVLASQICFSYLPPDMQVEVLRRIDSDQSYREQVQSLNHNTLRELSRLLTSTVVNRDKEIATTFGQDNYGKTLESVINYINGGCIAVDDERDIQGSLESIFFSPPYLRLLYGEAK